MKSEKSTRVFKKEVIDNQCNEANDDWLAVEEPLQIELEYYRKEQWLSTTATVTMRTPGEDVDLALGYLFTERIIASMGDIADIKAICDKGSGSGLANGIKVKLQPDCEFDLARLRRNTFTNSSCGVCGKATLDTLKLEGCALKNTQPLKIPAHLIHLLPEKLLSMQSAFESTGGIHATAFFDPSGELLSHREDIGRHNAVDKLIGNQLQGSGERSFADKLLLVSGRTSFDVLQKALVAGIPLIAGIGAPSSLAVELANAFNITLLGFVKNNRFNIYSCPERIAV